MKRIFTLIIFVAMLVAGGFAEAHWMQFTEAVDGTKAYWDVGTLTYCCAGTQNSASLWTKYELPSGDYWIDHEELLRSTKQQKLVSAHHYNSKGVVIYSWNTPTAWTDIVPGSLGDRLF